MQGWRSGTAMYHGIQWAKALWCCWTERPEGSCSSIDHGATKTVDFGYGRHIEGQNCDPDIQAIPSLAESRPIGAIISGLQAIALIRSAWTPKWSVSTCNTRRKKSVVKSSWNSTLSNKSQPGATHFAPSGGYVQCHVLWAWLFTLTQSHEATKGRRCDSVLSVMWGAAFPFYVFKFYVLGEEGRFASVLCFVC